MKKVMFMFISLLTVLGVCSCNDNEVIEPVVSDSVSDMEVLSRFVDVNEITNEYYFNENKKTRALSYVTGSDWQDLEKVSPLSIEKYKNNLQVLNAQVASAISNPNTAYVVFSSLVFIVKVSSVVYFLSNKKLSDIFILYSHSLEFLYIFLCIFHFRKKVGYGF